MPFKTTNEDLKPGDLVRIWCRTIYPDYKNYSILALVSRYYRKDVSNRGYWLFYTHEGEFSCDLHRVEIVSKSS